MLHVIKSIIVDDEENARLYMARMLSLSFPDMEIEFAVSPAEALFVLEKKKTDLIFLDVELPGMSGLEMLGELRDRRIETPVIFISQYKRPDFIQKALRLGAVDYIDKPVHPDELEVAVRKILIKRLAEVNNQPGSGKVCLSTSKGTLYLDPADIFYFETSGRESIAHTVNGESDIIVRESLVKLEKILPAENFRRVSRQCIVNVNYIKLVNKDKLIILEAGKCQVKLDKIYPQVTAELTKK